MSGLLIVPAASRDCDEVASVLGNAFRDDPHLRGLFLPKDRTELQNLMTAMFSVLAGAQVRSKFPLDMAVVDGKIVGAALWQPPGGTVRLKPRELFRVWRVTGRHALRAHHDHLAVEASRPGEPHWYLAAIGISTEAQGRGVARALIEHGLARADADKAGCQLEASNPILVAMYERFGWIDRGPIPSPSDVDTIAMWRPAPT